MLRTTACATLDSTQSSYVDTASAQQDDLPFLSDMKSSLKNPQLLLSHLQMCLKHNLKKSHLPNEEPRGQHVGQPRVGTATVPFRGEEPEAHRWVTPTMRHRWSQMPSDCLPSTAAATWRHTLVPLCSPGLTPTQSPDMSLQGPNWRLQHPVRQLLWCPLALLPEGPFPPACCSERPASSPCCSHKGAKVTRKLRTPQASRACCQGRQLLSPPRCPPVQLGPPLASLSVTCA